MSWVVHRWLLLCGITLFVFKGCQSLFLRHTQSGRCIAAGSLISEGDRGRRYWAEMVSNCLSDSARFSYLDTRLLHNIKTGGTLASRYGTKKYKNRLFIYDGKNQKGINFENNSNHRLKQTAAGSLFLYDNSVNSCAQPNGIYVDQKKDGCSDTAEQKFTFGSVTQYGNKMEDVNCSHIQHMVVKRADYGDFNKQGVFNDGKNIDTQCSVVTNCQVKSLCVGKTSCELTMDNNLLPSHYCSDTLKEIYTEYTCVDNNSSTTITAAPNIRLKQSPNQGFVEIKDGSTWRAVKEENWDINREKMLCQNLGFNETNANEITTGRLSSGHYIGTGDLICYSTQPSGTSCCVHLVPSTTTSNVSMPLARCKVCDKPLLQDTNTFPDKVFSGSGGSKYYQNARFAKGGWCASGSTPYLMLDLQKQYHITRIVVMADREQTKWSNSYSMKYSHAKTLVDKITPVKITGNQNGYQASITQLNRVYNARYIKIQSTTTGIRDFCLRIELCGEAQIPAPVYNIKVTLYKRFARVTWRIHRAPRDSSYITQIFIYLNGKEHRTVSRRTLVDIKELKPYAEYTVGIKTGDASSKRSNEVSKYFKTKEAAPSGPPLNVIFTSRDKYSLNVSWKAPHESLWNGKLTGYIICYSTRARAHYPRYSRRITTFSYTINNLRPSTKYFVTVSAATSVGRGPKSAKISKITNGEPVNPLTMSYYTLSLNIPKVANYIRELMVIVQIVTSTQSPNENIETSDLKPCRTNTQDSYITAYLKPDVLPLIFVIGDAKDYNSEKEKYFNQPLKPNSNYIVFLKFFESQDSYYSTEWSNNVKTMEKPPVEYLGCETSEQSSEDKKTRMDLLIPLVILALCFFLSLAVIIYQRRRFQNNNRKASHKPEALGQADQTGKFGPLDRNKSIKFVQAAQRDSYANSDTAYETPNAKAEISTEAEPSGYMSLNDKKEPANFYQSLQTAGRSPHLH